MSDNSMCIICGVSDGCRCKACGVSQPHPSTPESTKPSSVAQPEVKRYDNTSTGWVIEKGQLCIGSCSGGYKWVTFTDQAALKFPSQLDAERYMYATSQIPRDCDIREHMWVDDVASLRSELERVRQERDEAFSKGYREGLTQKQVDAELDAQRADFAESQLSTMREALELVVADGESILVACRWCGELCDSHEEYCIVTIAKVALGKGE